MEPLTDILEMLRLKAVVYYDQEFFAPLAMRFESSPYARVHIVVAGQCRIESNGTTVVLGPNDVALFPTGDEHRVWDGRTTTTRASREVYAEASRAPIAPDRPAPVVRLISGHLEVDGDARRLLFANLPTMMRTTIDDSRHGGFRALREELSRELETKSRGWESIVRRIAEILLIRIVRSKLGASVPADGLFAAFSDARLHAALALMHARFDESLTLAEIARAAGMSRSAFAAHFTSVAHMPAMTYLSHWRLLRGREMLSNRDLTVAHVAAACGHRSTEGFSRAFKRVYGLSPTRWR